MAPSYCSLASLYTLFLRFFFRAAQLKPKLISIDDKTTIHCWVPNGAPDKSRPAVVLVHGFGPSAEYQWHRQVRYLSRFFDLYVPDLVFFGNSTTSSPERSEVFQAKCVAELMERLGIERYSVVGTSYGGFVAYHMARNHGERVEKVVVASSAPNRGPRDTVEVMEKAKVANIEDLMMPSTAKQLWTLMSLSIYKPPSLMPNFLLNDVNTNIINRNRKEKIELLHGITLGRDDNIHIFPLPQEVLIVWGEYDQIFPLQKASELKRLLGENIQMEVMRKTSHVPQIENPKLFNNIVKNFLMTTPKLPSS